MRLVDADKLEQQLIQNLNEITKGEENDDMWKIAYSIIVVCTNALEKVPTVTNHYDCNHDCDALHEAYDRGFSKGFSEGREEEKKEVMLLTDHCIGKCDILESVLHIEGDKND